MYYHNHNLEVHTSKLSLVFWKCGCVCVYMCVSLFSPEGRRTRIVLCRKQQIRRRVKDSLHSGWVIFETKPHWVEEVIVMVGKVKQGRCSTSVVLLNYGRTINGPDYLFDDVEKFTKSKCTTKERRVNPFHTNRRLTKTRLPRHLTGWK